MPCKKKSISPLYFQIYTHLFTGNFFLLCMCADVVGCVHVCDLFLFYIQKEKLAHPNFCVDRSVYDKLEEKTHYTAHAQHYPVK